MKRREIYSKRDFQIFSDTGKIVNFVAKLPQDWKDAIIIPFNKTGGKWLTSNYRPILLTSIVLSVGMEY